MPRKIGLRVADASGRGRDGSRTFGAGEVTTTKELTPMKGARRTMTGRRRISALGSRRLLGDLVMLPVATSASAAVWADSAPTVAPAPTADLATRVAGLEAYVTNGTP